MFPLNQDVWGAAEASQYELPFWERLKSRPLNIGGLINDGGAPIDGVNDIVTLWDIPQMGEVVQSKGAKASIEKASLWKIVITPMWITSGVLKIDDDTWLSMRRGLTQEQLLSAMADRCSRRYDKMCIDSLTGPIQYMNGKVENFDTKTCVIPFDFGLTDGASLIDNYGNPIKNGGSDVAYSPDAIDADLIKNMYSDFRFGLTPEKINLATTIMAENDVPETARKVALLTADQMNRFRAHPAVKNTDYNIVPALRYNDLDNGAGYGDVAGFIKTNLVNTKKKAGGLNQNGGVATSDQANLVPIEYVYIVAFDLLTSRYREPWYPTITAKDNSESIPFNQMSMHGVYGVSRLQPQSVIAIECLATSRSKIPFVLS